MGKRLGQHFLRDPLVLNAIVAAAIQETALPDGAISDAGAPEAGMAVLEVGPGEGVLTERLLERGVRLCAVELDPVLAAALRKRWEGVQAFKLVEGDIRKVSLDPQTLFGDPAPYRVAANLPYYLSTPLLFRMARERAYFTRLVLMVQEEVALRVAASPSDGKTYGSLSVAMQHAFTPRMVCRVPPGAFKPPPKVHSAVIALEPRPPILAPDAEVMFFEHVKGLFTRRRKRMASAFKEAIAKLPPSNQERLEALLGDRRAETLTPDEHLEAFRLLHPGSTP